MSPMKPIKPGKPIKRPVKPIKPIVPRPEPIEPIGFDPDSYPIWINSTSFLHQVIYRAEDFSWHANADLMKNRTNEEKQLFLTIGLNVSSKVKLHGISIKYSVSNENTNINMVTVSKQHAQTGAWELKDRKEDILNRTFVTKYNMRLSEDLAMDNPLKLVLRLHFGKRENISIYGVKMMVKDV